MNALQLALRDAFPETKLRTDRGEYSPAELAAFRAEFATKLARRRKRRILFFIALGIVAVFRLLTLGEQEAFSETQMAFAGVLALFALCGVLLTPLPSCPACRQRTDAYFACYCPACGKQTINSETWFRHGACKNCGAAFDEASAQVDLICYCTSCGIRLNDGRR